MIAAEYVAAVNTEQNEVIDDPIPSDYISKPIRSENCTIPIDIMNFQHSYGYNCKKKYNLCVVGGNTVMFIAGNIMTFIDIQTKKMSFRRSAMGGGLGFICANSTTPHFAVGEKGSSPPIIIYEWPTLKVVAVLRNGTKKAFTYLNYSQDGSLLCSQGSEPDFLNTIWDWEKEKIILQCKSYGQEVSKCIFSYYKSSVLISVGNGHIKFWKIVKTFTGLKLEGELGIFDKTAPTDIIALLPTSQGMVLSGCEWGNMLLWNGNVIKYEISKRRPKTCHDGPITTIYYDDASDRLLTLGMDGCVKLWAYAPIHKTEMSEDMYVIGCLPIEEYEMKKTPAAFLSSMRQFPDDPGNDSWIVQDAKGAIWRMRLSVKNKCRAEECLLRVPSGKIVSMSCSPSGDVLAVLSEEGGLYIYDYIQKNLIGYQIFSERGTSVIWLPLKVDMRGNKLILGFGSGIIRMVSLSFLRGNEKLSYSNSMQQLVQGEHQKPLLLYQTKETVNSEDKKSAVSGGKSEENLTDERQDLRSRAQSFWGCKQKHSTIKVGDGVKCLDENVKDTHTELGEIKFVLQQVFRPHTKSISVISHNSNCSLFISGSDDGTVFFYNILKKDNVINLNPIGFVHLPSEVTCIDWKPNMPNTVLVCCSHGHVIEIILPRKDYKTTSSSCELNVKKKMYIFKSVKSQILRDVYLEQKEKEKDIKRARKLKELEDMKEKHGRLDVDAEAYLADSEEEEEMDPLYVPEIPNAILFGYFTESGNVRLSVGGYDAGYIYESDFETVNPISWAVIQGAEDTEAYCYIFTPNRKYLILGMGDGKIMVIKLKDENPTDLSDYWVLPMHDGVVRKLCFNLDYKILFSCGDDGNIFSYNFNDLESKPYSESLTRSRFFRRSSVLTPVDDILDSAKILSLEELRQKEEKEKEMKIAELQKDMMLNDIKNLHKRFNILLDRNTSLPLSQQLSHIDFELHPEITNIITNKINDQMDMLHRKHAWNVEKSKLTFDKIAECFINCLQMLTPSIRSFRNNKQVEGFRLKNIAEQFHEAKAATLKRLNQQSLKFRLPKGEAVASKIVLKTSQPSATFEAIMNSFLPPGNAGFSKMSSQAIRVMENYVKHKQKLDKRIAEWDALFISKPSDKKNDNVDIKAIEEAKLTIGDYKLKTSPNYRVPSHLRVTTIEKYHQMLQVHLMIHGTKLAFNEKISKLVETKHSLTIYLQQLLSELGNFKKESFAHHELLSTDPKTRVIKEILEKPRENTRKINDYLLYKHQMLEKVMEEEIGWLIDSGMPMPITNIMLSGTALEKGAELDTRTTPWEAESSFIHKDRHLYNVNIIQKTIGEEMASFDRDVMLLSNMKSELDLQLKYLEHYMITLQEELLIIRNFEAKEENLTEKVQDKLLEKNKMLEKILHLEDKFEMRKQNADDLFDQQKEIVANFHTAIANSNAASILKKIFKKRFKPVKIKSESESSDEESSSSESSSDSSEEDDDGEFVLPAKIDENVCPEGCAPELFEMTLHLRSQRHKVERDFIEEKKQIEVLKKDLELNYKKLKTIENAHQKNDEDLNAFQRDKQNKLNNLDVVAVLNLSQMQQLSSTTDLGAISECILFSKQKLERLHLRTKELEDESKNQNKRHRSLQKHLHHLKVDCKHMSSKISQLKEELTLRMEKKFGKVVNIMKLEQAILHKHLVEFRCQAQEMKDAYEQGYAEWQHQLYSKQNKLTEVITANTEKMSLLAALREEKTKLDKILKHQHKLFKSSAGEKMDLYHSDIAKLVKIKKQHQKQIGSLKEEIMKLSRNTKHGSLPPLELSKHKSLYTGEDPVMDDDQSTFKTEQQGVEEDPADTYQY